MQKSIPIKSHQFFSFNNSISKHQSVSHFINLSLTCDNVSIITQNISKCKYCKAYPFNIRTKVSQNMKNECELCGSINQHQMRFNIQLENSSYHNYLIDNSYLLQSNANSIPKPPALIFFLQIFEETQIFHFIEALKKITQNYSNSINVLICLKGKLAIVDFVKNPEIIVLSKDTNIFQMIEETRCVLKPQNVDQLQQILLMLSQQPSELRQFYETNALSILDEISSQLQKSQQYMNVLVWIGKFPSVVGPIHTKNLHRICSIAILSLTKKSQNLQSQIQLSQRFTQIHYLNPPDIPTQLYYKSYQIIQAYYLNCFTTSVITLRTNKQYTGQLRNVPQKLINENAAPIQVFFEQDQITKMQICVQFIDFQGQHLKLVVNNFQQKKKRQKMIWLENVVMMSRALNNIKVYFNSLRSQDKNPGFDYFFIVNTLQKYGQKHENRTQRNIKLLRHISNYFKEFQKDAYKMYLPFSLIGKHELIFLFYPLWQNGILYHYDCMWVTSQGEKQVDWMINELLHSVRHIHREKKLPIFYQLCLDNEFFSYFQEEA